MNFCAVRTCRPLPGNFHHYSHNGEKLPVKLWIVRGSSVRQKSTLFAVSSLRDVLLIDWVRDELFEISDVCLGALVALGFQLFIRCGGRKFPAHGIRGVIDVIQPRRERGLGYIFDVAFRILNCGNMICLFLSAVRAY